MKIYIRNHGMRASVTAIRTIRAACILGIASLAACTINAYHPFGTPESATVPFPHDPSTLQAQSTPQAQSMAQSQPITQSQQQAMSPDQAFARLVEGNKRFSTGKSLHRDYVSEAAASATGQYPFATVLSCIDSRSIPEIIFDQGIGDLFVPRVAGNYAPTDIVGSMEFATKVAGSKLIVVLGHSECGAIKGTCDNVELGNLTSVLAAIHPALNDVKDIPGERNSKNKQFVQAVTLANVHRTVDTIRLSSPIMRQMEESGQIKVVGAIQDLATGEVTFLP